MSVMILFREARAEFLAAARQPGYVLPTLLFPTMFYVFFALLFSMSRSMHMPTWLLATYGVFGIMAPALFGFGVGIASEKGEGWLRLKRVVPVHPLVPLFARTVMAMLFAFAVFVMLATLGAVFGDVAMPRGSWVLLATTLTFGAIPFCAMGLAIGLWLSPQAAPAVVNLVFLPMSFLSGLWIPLQAFPGWMQTLAHGLPPFHLAELALHVVGAKPAGSIGISMAALAVFTALFLAVAAVGWKRFKES